MCYPADSIPDPYDDPEGYEQWFAALLPDDRPADACWPAGTVIVEISPDDGAA